MSVERAEGIANLFWAVREGFTEQVTGQFIPPAPTGKSRVVSAIVSKIF